MLTWLEIGLPASVALYYAIAILRVRKNPPRTPLVVQYDSPDNLSPAAIRYVWKGCIDQRTIACVFAELATKGYIQLTPENGSYRIHKLKSGSELASEERLAMDWLFSNFLTEKEFHPAQHSQGCISALTGSITKQIGDAYYTTHYAYAFSGFLVSIAGALLLAVSSGARDRTGVYLLTWMTFGGVVLAAITFIVLIGAVRDLTRGIGNISRVVFGIFVAAFATVPVTMLVRQFANTATVGVATATMLLAAINVVAITFLKSPTTLGYVVRQQVEGFREFLLAVDQDRLDRLPGAPHVRKEANLGYAIALEVKEAWGDELANACYPQFSSIKSE